MSITPFLSSDERSDLVLGVGPYGCVFRAASSFSGFFNRPYFNYSFPLSENPHNAYRNIFAFNPMQTHSFNGPCASWWMLNTFGRRVCNDNADGLSCLQCDTQPNLVCQPPIDKKIQEARHPGGRSPPLPFASIQLRCHPVPSKLEPLRPHAHLCWQYNW
uniref:Uncharacterized protein n=1 Tax=Rhipicephalus zambeziensis TaxID=60191 RepID=A0A224Y5Y6_9ACAR